MAHPYSRGKQPAWLGRQKLADGGGVDEPISTHQEYLPRYGEGVSAIPQDTRPGKGDKVENQTKRGDRYGGADLPAGGANARAYWNSRE